jgi:hypothetical protein
VVAQQINRSFPPDLATEAEMLLKRSLSLSSIERSPPSQYERRREPRP